MNNRKFSSMPPQFQPEPQPQIQPKTFYLPGVGELLSESFQVYKSRIGVFLGIMIIPILIFLLILLPVVFFGYYYLLQGLNINPLLLGLLMAVFGIIMAIISLWMSVSLLYAIKEREQKIGIKESLAKGWHKIISYLWISILSGFIIGGGFLLLIIPGIIIALWFSLAAYVLVSEDLKGMNVLFRSKQLIKGYWGKVFWRFLVLGLIMWLITFIVQLIPLIGAVIINLFVTPFSFVFIFLVYENLKRLKGEVPLEPPKRKTKIGFTLLGILGFLFISAILASIVFLFFSP